MTREQKIEWLENASNEEVLKQYETSIRTLDRGLMFDRENLEDVQLVKAELLKRMEAKA